MNSDLCQAVGEAGIGGDEVIMMAAVDDLHVVDADHGQSFDPCEEVREGLEIRDDNVGVEVVVDLFPDREVFLEALGRQGEV